MARLGVGWRCGATEYGDARECGGESEDGRLEECQVES